MNNSKCTIYKSSFFADLYPYSINTSLSEGKQYINFKTGARYPESKEIKYNLNLSKYISTPELHWKPAIIHVDSTSSIIKNNAILGKTQVKTPILGIEDIISFEPVFKHWTGTNLKMSCNWFISPVTGGIYPEYGVLFWYRKRISNYNSKEIFSFKNIPNYLPIYTKQTIKAKDGRQIPPGSVVVKISDTIIVDKSIDTHTNSGNEGFIHREKSSDVYADISSMSDTEKDAAFYFTSYDIYAPNDNYDYLGDIWISDGEAFSYYNNLNEKRKHKKSNIFSHTYLSPGLFPIYRDIYNRLTKRDITCPIVTIPEPNDCVYSTRSSFALQKLCYFLSTSPLSDGITTDMFLDQEVNKIVKDYLASDDEERKLMFAIDEIMKLYTNMSTRPQQKTINNNYLRSWDDITQKLLTKYGAVLSVDPATTTTLKYRNEISNHIISSIGYLSTYPVGTSTGIILYNNTKFDIGNISYETKMAPSSGYLNISTDAGPAKNHSIDFCQVPLADANLPQIHVPDIYAGGVINIPWKPGSSNAGTNKEMVIDHDIWSTNNAQLEADSARYSWELYAGNSCLRFRDTSKDLNNKGAPVYPPQRRFQTTVDATPMIFVKDSGIYDLKVTRTLYRNVSQSDIVTLNVGGFTSEFVKPDFINESYSYSKIMCASTKTFASHRKGLLWLIDTDHYYDKGYGTDIDDYATLYGVTRLKNVKFNLQEKLKINNNIKKELSLSFIGGNAGFWIYSVDIEYMRDSGDSTKKCKSFYTEKVARSNTEQKLILGSSDFSRISINRYDFSARNCGTTEIKDITFQDPNVSTRSSPAIKPYGGYNKKKIDSIGIVIPGHPKISGCMPQLPALTKRNDFAYDPKNPKICYPIEIQPTGTLEAWLKKETPPAGSELNDGSVPFYLGSFKPAEGWDSVVTSEEMSSICGCSPLGVSGKTMPVPITPKYDDFKIASTAIAGSKVIQIEAGDNQIARFDSLFLLKDGDPESIFGPGGSAEAFIFKIKTAINEPIQLTLNFKLKTDVPAGSTVRIYYQESTAISEVCAGSGDMYIEYNMPPMLSPKQVFARYRIYGINSDDEVIEMYNTNFIGSGFGKDEDGFPRDCCICKTSIGYPGSVPSSLPYFRATSLVKTAQGETSPPIKVHKRCDIIKVYLVADAPCPNTEYIARLSCPTWNAKSAVIDISPEHQECFSFKGTGFLNIRPGSRYESSIYIDSLPASNFTPGDDTNYFIKNHYGVGGIDSSEYSNYSSRSFAESTNTTWDSAFAADDFRSSNICGGLYKKYSAHPRIKDTKIYRIDIKLNFLNYFNPKNLQIWLEVLDEGNNSTIINLMNQEHIDKYKNNFTITFSDYADKYTLLSKPTGPVTRDESGYKLDDGVLYTNKISLVSDGGRVLSSMNKGGINDLKREKMNIENKEDASKKDLVYKMSLNQKLIGSKFILNIKSVNYLVNDSKILDNLSYHNEMVGNNSFFDKNISNTSTNSLCSWEAIVYTKDIKNPISYNYENSIDYSSVNWKNLNNANKPRSSGIQYMADFTDHKYLLPLVNINAPYQSLANYNTCSYNDEILGKNPYVRRPEFPSLLPYYMAGMGFGFGTIMGGLTAVYLLNSFYGNGGRNDPIINYFIESRLSNQTETTNGQYYKPVYNEKYFGQANRAILCVSKDKKFWYSVEVPFFRYINTPTFRRNLYDYIQITANTENNKKSHLYNLAYKKVKLIEDLELSEQEDINRYEALLKENPKMFSDKNYVLVNGKRAMHLFNSESKGLDSVLVDKEIIQIRDMKLILTKNGLKTLIIFDKEPMLPDTGYLGKIKNNMILVYNRNKMSIDGQSVDFARWVGEKTNEDMFVNIKPTIHPTTYSPGSIGWGTNIVEPKILPNIEINNSNIPTIDLINSNDIPINNGILMIEASGEKSIWLSKLTDDNGIQIPQDPDAVPIVGRKDLHGYVTTFEDYGYITHPGIPISIGKNIFADGASPAIMELKCDAFEEVVGDQEYNFFSGTIHIENDFLMNPIGVLNCGASTKEQQIGLARLPPANIKNWYWFSVNPEQECILVDELSIKYPLTVELTAVPIVDTFIERSNILPDRSLVIGPGSLVTSEGGAGKYKYTFGSIDQIKKDMGWADAETFVYGDADPSSGDSKKLLIGLGDSMKDNLIAIKETYVRPIPPLGKKPKFKDIIDVDMLGPGGIPTFRGSADKVETFTLWVKFRNIPRHLKSVDSEDFEKYIYDKQGNLSKGIGTFANARSVGQLANNFICWECVDEYGRKLDENTPDFFKVMNEMYYRAFFGSDDRIEFKTDFMDSQDAWEWIPYELFAAPSVVNYSNDMGSLSDYIKWANSSYDNQATVATPIGTLDGVNAEEKIKIRYHLPKSNPSTGLFSLGTPTSAFLLLKSGECDPGGFTINLEESQKDIFTEIEYTATQNGSISFVLVVSYWSPDEDNFFQLDAEIVK